MISYFQDYVTIGAVLGFGLFLVVLLLGVASVLRPNKPYAEKLQTYECGVDPVGTGWSQTYVRYYIFGLLFVIFDVEAWNNRPKEGNPLVPLDKFLEDVSGTRLWEQKWHDL